VRQLAAAACVAETSIRENAKSNFAISLNIRAGVVGVNAACDGMLPGATLAAQAAPSAQNRSARRTARISMVLGGIWRSRWNHYYRVEQAAAAPAANGGGGLWALADAG